MHTLFHKKPNKDDLPLKSPDRKIKNSQVQRKKSIKFPGVMLNENLDWQKHIRTIEKKKQKAKKGKNIGLLYRANYLIKISSLRCICFGYIHSYLNYANIILGSTYQTKLKSIHLLQKRTIRIIFNEGKMTHSRPFLRSLNTSNDYQINLFQHV